MNFARKLTLLFSVIVLTISVIISYFVYTSNVKMLEEQIRDKMEEQAFHTMDKIDRMIGARHARLKRFISTTVISSGKATPKEILEEMRVFMKDSPGSYVSLSFFGLDRVRIADTSGEHVGSVHPFITYWKKLAEGRDFVMDVSQSVSLKKTLIHMAFAVKDHRGAPVGYLVARLPLEKFYDTLDLIAGPSNVKLEKSLEVDLVNEDGVIIYSKYDREAVLKEVSPDWEIVRVDTSRGLIIGSGRHTHPKGHPRGEEFYAFAKEHGYRDYKGSGWVLILNIPTSVVFMPAIELRSKVLISLSVMSAGALFIIAVFARSVTRPISELSEASVEIGKGNLAARVAVKSGGEIGLLAESFNRMAENIKSSRDEIITSREYTSNILHSMHESLIVITLEGVIMDVNSAAMDLLGYSEDELKGEHICKILGDGFSPFVGIEIEQLIEKGFLSTVDKVYRLKNGENIPVLLSASVMRDSAMQIKGIVCVALDNTEHKAAEQALKESEERYRNLFEESKDIVFTGSLEGRVHDMNKAGLEFFGFRSKNEAFMADLSGHYRDRSDWERFREEARRSGFVRNFEAVLRDSSGSEKTVSMTANAVDGDKGGTLAYRSIMRDVTGQRRLERRLLQARKMEAIGEFTGKMAHDFKNILTVISSNGGILKSRIKDDETSEECVELVLSASKRAANLIQGLLAFSRNQDVALRPVSLNRVIASVDKLLSSVAGENVELRIDLSGDNPTVLADSGQIEQVLMNLAANAADAMPAGGVLSISTSLMKWDGGASKDGELKSSVYALLTVSDTGVGMDEKTQERIFEPFFTTKEVRKGTGLGLSIVYGIIDGCKGFINVYSEPGKGSTFQIFLPVASRAEDPAEEPEPAPPARSGTETILFAEDDPEVRKTVRFIFEENGYRVVEAADGAEAVRRFVERSDAIRVLVLDVRMPGKNGREAYEEIKRLSPGIKAVFISAYTEDIIDREWIAEEKLGFVLKPFAQEELLREVRRMIDLEA